MSFPADVFSLAQILGYVTFALGMVTFSRKQDGHFRWWLTLQNLVYALHFLLMGNLAGTAGMGLSIMRNLLSMKTRSWTAVMLLLAANLGLAFFVVKAAWNVFAMLAAAVATVAMFRLHGLALRCGMLLATLLWLLNNIFTGSIGGIAMESMITVISCVTIWRLYRERQV